MKLTRILIALFLFGVSFGYVEAAVVVYMRAVFGPVREQVLSGIEYTELFPLIVSTQTLPDGPKYALYAKTELGRELATLIMLATVGLALGGSFRRWLAGFMISFGVWDIFYYVFLKLILDWPESLWTWDLLFLLPLPWVGPVITPVIVSLAMITAGVILLWREARGRPIEFYWYHWAAIYGGGATIIVAFCWDYRHILAGGQPEYFNWPLFLLGQGVGAAGFLSAAWWTSGVPGSRLAQTGECA